MVPVGHTQSGQAPGVFEIGIQREAVGLKGKRRAAAMDTHGSREIVPQGGLEVRAPARRLGWKSGHGEKIGRGVEACVESAAAKKTDLLRIELVKIVNGPAGGEPLVVVERVFEEG